MRWIATLGLLVTVAGADEGQAAQLEQLAKSGKPLEAARVAGTWAAKAQKSGDVLEEEAAWQALRKGVGDAQYRDACAEVMKQLDPKRNGAYLSAHLLAFGLLRAAIREGDDAHVADAVRVLEARRKDAGACAAALTALAHGVAAARKAPAGAVGPLTTAFEAAMKNGWLDLATHAGIELACVEKQVGREGTTLQRLDEALRAHGDRSLVQVRNALAAKRIPESRLDVGGGSVSAAGGRGGRGGVEGSPVGAAWNGLKSTKPLVVVKRAAQVFKLEPGFKGAKDGECVFKTGVFHGECGGITLSFCDTGVGLAMIDLTGRRGQPGESSQPRSWQFFYLLAPGETWSVTKTGVVSVKK